MTWIGWPGISVEEEKDREKSPSDASKVFDVT